MSPFRSKAQARYLYAKRPAVAKEFATKTENVKALPEKVKKKKRKQYRLAEGGVAKY